MPAYTIRTGEPNSIICILCGSESFSRKDVEQKYCRHCKVFLSDISTQWTYRLETESWFIAGKSCVVIIVRRPRYCDRGNFLAQIFPTPDTRLALPGGIDDADGWPRYYFDLTRARLEIEAWLDKRGERLG